MLFNLVGKYKPLDLDLKEKYISIFSLVENKFKYDEYIYSVE